MCFTNFTNSTEPETEIIEGMFDTIINFAQNNLYVKLFRDMSLS